MIDGFESAVLHNRIDLAKSLFETYRDTYSLERAHTDLFTDSLLKQYYLNAKKSIDKNHSLNNPIEVFQFFLKVNLPLDRFSNIIESTFNMIDYESFGEFIVGLGQLDILNNAYVKMQLIINSVRSLAFAGNHEAIAETARDLDASEIALVFNKEVIDQLKEVDLWQPLKALLYKDNLKDPIEEYSEVYSGQSQLSSSASEEELEPKTQPSEFHPAYDSQELGLMIPLYHASRQKPESQLDAQKEETSPKAIQDSPPLSPSL